jgi:succinate-acetate transporter protein
VLILWTPAFFKTLSILSFVVLAIDVALPFLALIDLGILNADYAVIPAYALLVAALLAMYLSAAIVVNTAFGKNLFPVIDRKK